MARLLIHVEGLTEETFVNEVLRDHLVANGYDAVDPRILGNARLRSKRGGIRPWRSVRRDITNHLKEDPSCIASTMVDYYGLPREGGAAWPGRASVSGQGSVERARFVEAAMLEDVVAEMGNQPYPERFVPFIVMHEFEGLLFSDCAAFSKAIGRSDLEDDFMAIRDGFSTPEEINDSPDKAPSKRVEALLPGYQKPLLGTLAVLEIGLPRIRAECPHFNQWLEKLESMVR
ncbi:MAG: DUF4276 family protein [Acidobacteriia bacterium]|nr:DUF4276 family protein [Terriglobia bacterium]